MHVIVPFERMQEKHTNLTRICNDGRREANLFRLPADVYVICEPMCVARKTPTWSSCWFGDLLQIDHFLIRKLEETLRSIGQPSDHAVDLVSPFDMSFLNLSNYSVTTPKFLLV